MPSRTTSASTTWYDSGLYTPFQPVAWAILTVAEMQDEDGNHKLPAEEVATIKQELVGLMILSPPNIQTQLGEAISVIADSDFWKRWDTLIQVC